MEEKTNCILFKEYTICIKSKSIQRVYLSKIIHSVEYLFSFEGAEEKQRECPKKMSTISSDGRAPDS